MSDEPETFIQRLKKRIEDGKRDEPKTFGEKLREL